MRNKLGAIGEQLVAEHLQKQGFTIVARNYRKMYGEIDLIATKGTLLVFVEVKTRRRHTVDLAEVIVPSKQRKIVLTAKTFLAEHPYHQHDCRFDVALVETDSAQIQYMPSAFDAAAQG